MAAVASECRFKRASCAVYALALALTGCSSVTSLHPLSQPARPAEAERFEGVWQVNDDAIHVRFASNGVAHFAGVEWKDEAFRLTEGEAIVTEGETYNFLSVRFQEDGEWKESYTFLQYDFTDGGDMILWMPEVDAFAEAVASNRLQGSVTQEQYSTRVELTDPPEQLLEYLQGPENLTLFEFRKPMILRRISPREAAPAPQADDAETATPGAAE